MPTIPRKETGTESAVAWAIPNLGRVRALHNTYSLATGLYLSALMTLYSNVNYHRYISRWVVSGNTCGSRILLGR